MSIESVYEKLKPKLQTTFMDHEILHYAAIADEILALKEERNAVILGHNYMHPALFHSIPDFTGDSLDLSRKAAATQKDVIVFCGVEFMAQTAKILNPAKTVLIPSRAGCSLATSIRAADVRDLKEQFPGAPVVSYVNTYADVKAESDYCCTSSNAAKVVEIAASQAKTDTVIFLPDQYLAMNVAKETGKQIIFPSKTFDGKGGFDKTARLIGWTGKCVVHERFNVEDIKLIRQQYPDVTVLAHPECSPQVIDESDFSGSTNAMIKYVEEKRKGPFLMLTECAMSDNIAAANPDVELLRLCSVRCPYMNEITLENTLTSLKEMVYKIDIPEEIRRRAEIPLRRMIEIG